MVNSKERTYIIHCIDLLISRVSTCYYGCILSRLTLREATHIPEFAVSPDGELLYNPTIDSIQHKDVNRTLRDLLHEAGHIALEHFARKEMMSVKGENHKAFNIAADCAIEAFLDRDFPLLPGDPKHHEGLKQSIPRDVWDSQSTEQMYAGIASTNPEDKDTPEANHIPILSRQGKQAIQGAMHQAAAEAKDKIIEAAEKEAATNTNRDSNGKKAGTSTKAEELLGLSSDLANISSMDSLIRLFKKTYGRGEASDDSVFNQRAILRREFEGMALMGRHQRSEVEQFGEVEEWHNDVVIYCDVSGSMDKQSIVNAFKLILKFAVKYGVAPVTVHTYNQRHVDTFIIDASTNLDKLQIRTGGGTNINRVIGDVPPKNKLVFILTDMADSPITQWTHDGELVWLIHDNYDTNHGNFTLGQKIYINDIIGNP